MRSVLIFVESRYPANRKRIRKTVEDFLDEEKIRSKVEVSIAIVGDRKMKLLNKKYRGLTTSTTVLAFMLTPNNKRDDFIYPDDGILRLGEVVISYPQAIARAIEDNTRVDDKIDELLIHGMRNLLGKGE